MSTETQARGWVSDLSQNGYGGFFWLCRSSACATLSLSLSPFFSLSVALSVSLSASPSASKSSSVSSAEEVCNSHRPCAVACPLHTCGDNHSGGSRRFMCPVFVLAARQTVRTQFEVPSLYRDRPLCGRSQMFSSVPSALTFLVATSASCFAALGLPASDNASSTSSSQRPCTSKPSGTKWTVALPCGDQQCFSCSCSVCSTVQSSYGRLLLFALSPQVPFRRAR